MKLFTPDDMFDSVTDITPQFLTRNGIKALILDVDNTLTTHGNPQPGAGILQWLDEMHKAKIPMILVSNNSRERVRPFAELLSLDFISRGCKPLTIGLTKACKKFSLCPGEVAIVGDQLFTDILGGKLKGLRCILTAPIQEEDGPFFRLKRKLENRLMKDVRKEKP